MAPTIPLGAPSPPPESPLTFAGSPCAGRLTDSPKSNLPDLPTPFESSDGDTDANAAIEVSTNDHLNMEAEILSLRAIHSEEFERYKRGRCYPEKFYEEGKPTIDPFTTSFCAPPLPDGWRSFVHPEGTRYFYYDDPGSPVPVLTDAWIYEKMEYDQVASHMDLIFKYMAKKEISFREITPSRHVSPSEPRIPRRQRTRNESVYIGSTYKSDPFEDCYPQYLKPTILVLDVRLSGNVGYYFVSHARQTLFWLDPFDYSMAVCEVHTGYTPTLIGLEMKRHYWMHNELFPHLYELEERDIVEIDDMVGFALGDVLTSSTGTSRNFTQHQLKQVERLIHRYDTRRWARRRRSDGERRFIFRILADFYHERFLNLYGEWGARLNNTQSVHYSPHRREMFPNISPSEPPTPPTASTTSTSPIASMETTPRQEWYEPILRFLGRSRATRCHTPEDGPEPIGAEPLPVIDPGVEEMHTESPVMKVLSWLMFGGPGVHMRSLRDITTDRIVSRNVLAKYMERMREEWQAVTLFGTVLLGVNISFLTIQTVDDAGRLGSEWTGPQRASYFSILASIGTVVSGFLLAGRHREAMNYTFIVHRSNTRWGLESLALMYGTPFSLAIWSILSFFMSLALLWFSKKDYVLIGLSGLFSLAFAPFILWAILAPYETKPYEFFATKAFRRVRRVGGEVTRGSMSAVRRTLTRMATLTLHETAAPAGSVAAPLHDSANANTALPWAIIRVCTFRQLRDPCVSTSAGNEVSNPVGSVMSSQEEECGVELAQRNRERPLASGHGV